MASAKEIVVKPISSYDAKSIIESQHYSGKALSASVLHLGVFLGGACGGAMSFGSPTDKRKMIGLVRDTGWGDFVELNRMAFCDWLPRNSESRALSIAFRILERRYKIKWVLSFSDATQCGDGAIYRASGFLLTQIKKNNRLVMMPNGDVVHVLNLKDPSARIRYGGSAIETETQLIRRIGAKELGGYMLRYIRLLRGCTVDMLTCPIIPFDEIRKCGASMYKGARPASIDSDVPGDQPGEGGASPTAGLQEKLLTPDPTSDRTRST